MMTYFIDHLDGYMGYSFLLLTAGVIITGVVVGYGGKKKR